MICLFPFARNGSDSNEDAILPVKEVFYIDFYYYYFTLCVEKKKERIAHVKAEYMNRRKERRWQECVGEKMYKGGQW